jgi:hypothetical protein
MQAQHVALAVGLVLQQSVRRQHSAGLGRSTLRSRALAYGIGWLLKGVVG